jgi:hypothetical protein
MFCIFVMCKCVLPPGVNTIAVEEYININIQGGSNMTGTDFFCNHNCGLFTHKRV